MKVIKLSHVMIVAVIFSGLAGTIFFRYFEVYEKAAIEQLLFSVDSRANDYMFGYHEDNFIGTFDYTTNYVFTYRYNRNSMTLRGDGSVYVNDEYQFSDKEMVRVILEKYTHKGLFFITEQTLFYRNFLRTGKFANVGNGFLLNGIEISFQTEGMNVYRLRCNDHFFSHLQSDSPEVSLLNDLHNDLNSFIPGKAVWPLGE
ncbi:MAG: hypothetical protein K9M54_13470 [Kiritimatiellales bacterium]|nr:hypothetical protein [Kiritimatiellales bacterium]